MRTRRGKRNRTTLHDQPVLYSTLQVGEQDTHNTPPTGPGERQQDYYNTGGQYDDVVIKLKPQPSIPSGYEVIYDYREDTMTVEGNKNDSKKNTDDPSSVHVYTLPDKQKGKKTKDKGRKEQDSQDPELLYAKVNKQAKTERKEEANKGKVELFYAKVNALTKKEKKEPQQDNGGIIGLQNISPPDLRLDYEPSADSDSTPQQQDGEGNTTQPTPSATVEGLYAEVDKTKKKNKKKDEE